MATLVVVVLVGPAILRILWPDPAGSLEKIAAHHRWIYPRLSVPQSWAPCHERPSIEPFVLPDCSTGLAARRTELQEIVSAPSAWQKDAPLESSLAFREIFLGRPSRAALHLDNVLAAEKMPPELWIDRSAIELLEAEATGDPRHFLKTLTAAGRAVKLNPHRSEPFFNLALALEALGLREAAAKAWKNAYLREPPDSPWAEEARARFRSLSGPPLSARWEEAVAAFHADPFRSPAPLEAGARVFPQKAREWGVTVLLADWAERWQAGDVQEANHRLVAAERMGDILLEETADPLLRDAVVALRRAQARSSPATIAAAAYGHSALARALVALEEARPGESVRWFARAIPDLARIESPVARWAEAWEGIAYTAQFHYPEARRRLELLLVSLAGSPFRSVRGIVHRQLGVLANNGGRPEEGIVHLRQALAAFASPGDAGDLAFTYVLLGESYDILGDRALAWRHFAKAAQLDLAVEDPYRHIQIANSLADFTLRQREVPLSRLYQDTAVAAALRFQRNPSFTADVLNWRAVLNARRNNLPAAEADLRAAGEQGARISDPERRAQFEADTGLITGLIALERAPRRAVDVLTRAIKRYEQTAHAPNLLLAYEARAAAFHRLGELRAKRADLKRSLELYESLGRELQDDGYRLALAGVLENAFDQMARAELLEEKNPLRAVYWLERAKALNYPIRHKQQWETDPVSLARVASSLPAGTALVEYALLSDRLVLWVLEGGQVSPREVIVSRSIIEATVERFVGSPWGSPAWQKASADLYGWLLGGWYVPGRIKTLILVPDKDLFALPWAALRDPRAGNLLIEQVEVGISPSASLFVRAREQYFRAEKRARRPLLVVADPDFNRQEHETLAPLAASRQEGAEIRRLFPAQTTELSGASATPRAFLDRAPDAYLIHFGGHALASPDRPLQSSLVLAAAPGEGRGTVKGEEIQRLTFRETRLVVLSACETAAMPQSGWPGAMSLARPFLTAGVPAVLGTLWSVDDRSARPVVVDFYTALRRGAPPLTALRDAQLHAIQRLGADRFKDRDWAAFVLVGGPSPQAIF